MSAPEEFVPGDRCLHCNQQVRRINYALGPEWMHVEPGASFPTERKGTAWRYCRKSVATPRMELAAASERPAR